MLYSTDELIDRADGAGALLSCHSEHLDAAEIALLLMPGAARRAAEGDRLIRARQWRLRSPAFMVGTQNTGKALGIIGMGRVGRVTARGRARGALIGDEALQEAAPGLDVFNGEPDIHPGYRRRHGFPGTGQSGRDIRRPGAGGSRGMTVFRCCTWRVSLFKLLVYRIQESVEILGPDGPPRPDACIAP